MGTPVGLRELRQDASDLVRQVQAGEEIDITVAGRLVPVKPRRWQHWNDIETLFAGPSDPDWEHDRDTIDNPWPNQ